MNKKIILLIVFLLLVAFVGSRTFGHGGEDHGDKKEKPPTTETQTPSKDEPPIADTETPKDIEVEEETQKPKDLPVAKTQTPSKDEPPIAKTQTPSLQNIPNVQQKIQELRDLSIGGIGYKGLQDSSLDIIVSIKALYEEARLYKELAQLRAQYEIIPAEVPGTVAVPQSPSVEPETADKKTKDKDASAPETEASTEKVSKSKTITLDASRINPFINNVLIYFSNDNWFWCIKPYFSTCKKDNFKKVTNESPAKEEINDEHYELVSGLVGKDFNDGVESLLSKLISLKFKDSDMIFKIEDIGDVSPESREIVEGLPILDLKIGEIIYLYVADQSKDGIIGYPQEGDYEKALNDLKEILKKS